MKGDKFIQPLHLKMVKRSLVRSSLVTPDQLAAARLAVVDGAIVEEVVFDLAITKVAEDLLFLEEE